VYVYIKEDLFITRYCSGRLDVKLRNLFN